MKLRSTMQDVRKTFEDQTKYFSTDEVAKYHKMSIKVLKLMKELEKTQPELIKEHNQVLEVLLNNYDQQIENIKSQINIIGKFLDCVEVLGIKPDDELTLKVITEYKKNLGLI